MKISEKNSNEYLACSFYYSLLTAYERRRSIELLNAISPLTVDGNVWELSKKVEHMGIRRVSRLAAASRFIFNRQATVAAEYFIWRDMTFFTFAAPVKIDRLTRLLQNVGIVISKLIFLLQYRIIGKSIISEKISVLSI